MFAMERKAEAERPTMGPSHSNKVAMERKAEAERTTWVHHITAHRRRQERKAEAERTTMGPSQQGCYGAESRGRTNYSGSITVYSGYKSDKQSERIHNASIE